MKWNSSDYRRKINELSAINADLLAALKDCATELAELVEAHYVDTKRYPGELRRYERDMASVHAARAAIAKAEQVRS